FYELITSDNYCLVAKMKKNENKDKLLGQITFESNTDWDFVDHVISMGILVHPSYRNIGVGYALIEEGLKEALKRGKKKVILSVFHTNTRAIALYKKFGFEIVGRRKWQFYIQGKYVDEILMEKWLIQFQPASMPPATAQGPKNGKNT
ncbi:MAG: GNAT family N-acetyltransferase, partial [Promethearchaeota archaeon]